MGSSTQVTAPERRLAVSVGPPLSSPRMASPDRSCANRSRNSRSVSVSTTVTGSVGVVLDCTASSPSAPASAPKTSARRRRTNAAASAASVSATDRSCAGWFSGVLTDPSHHRCRRVRQRRGNAANQPSRPRIRVWSTPTSRRGDSMTTADSTSARTAERRDRDTGDGAVSASTSAAAASRAASSTWTPANSWATATSC